MPKVRAGDRAVDAGELAAGSCVVAPDLGRDVGGLAHARFSFSGAIQARKDVDPHLCHGFDAKGKCKACNARMVSKWLALAITADCCARLVAIIIFFG